jgi:radical SAM protein with 4Fe4S-binding SPASM domain
VRCPDAVIKHSAGRLTLQALTSNFHVRVNESALTAIARALSTPSEDGPGRALVERLAARGLLPGDPSAPFDGFERRDASDLVSVELEPANTCNLACRHCFVAFRGRRMTPAVFEAALSGAVELGAVEMVFNGGEPLLHPKTLEFIERARAARLRVVLFTNGTRVTPAVADRLAAARLAKVAISLDGAPAHHDELRGAGAYAAAVTGLRRLTARGVPVQVTVAVHPGNVTDVDTLVRRCREDWGVQWVRLTTIVAMGRGRDHPDLRPDDALFAQYHEAPTCSSTPLPGALPCLAGVDKLFVGAWGDVHGCHLFDQAPPMGLLTERALAEIYRHPAGPQGAALHDFDAARLADCIGCPAVRDCKGGCRARAHRIGGSFGSRDPEACRAWGVTSQATAN